ncbi:hypothetical protein HBN50_09045 [Halobacteriovorax sp. GB3]|uniref:hypothetical protein n=1 Tax=Halobacteriovorax sp. GB3 TaxID=2719615 RepID=UPI002362E9AC|nr:hypothetical protein [Halobacteriovorax sp. GB3]MDD0853243.1 hypothetical protein [Halobacteriovorax sp. GB3]
MNKLKTTTFILSVASLLEVHAVTPEKLKCTQIKDSILTVEKVQNELSTPIGNGDHKYKVKELKSEYDRLLARLVLLEGIKDLKSKYNKFKHSVLTDENFGVINANIFKDFDTISQGIESAKKLSILEDQLTQMIGDPRKELAAMPDETPNVEDIGKMRDNAFPKIETPSVLEKVPYTSNLIEKKCEEIVSMNDRNLCSQIDSEGYQFFSKGETTQMIEGFFQAFHVGYSDIQSKEERKKVLKQFLELVKKSKDGEEGLFGLTSTDELKIFADYERSLVHQVMKKLDVKSLPQEQVDTTLKGLAHKLENKMIPLNPEKSALGNCLTASILKSVPVTSKTCFYQAQALNEELKKTTPIMQALLAADQIKVTDRDIIDYDKVKKIQDEIKAMTLDLDQYSSKLNKLGKGNAYQGMTNIMESLCRGETVQDVDHERLTNCIQTVNQEYLDEEYKKAKRDYELFKKNKLLPGLSAGSNPKYMGMEALKRELIKEYQVCKDQPEELNLAHCNPKVDQSRFSNFKKFAEDAIVSLDDHYSTSNMDKYDALKLVSESCDSIFPVISSLNDLDKDMMMSMCADKKKSFKSAHVAREKAQEVKRELQNIGDYNYTYDADRDQIIKTRRKSSLSFFASAAFKSMSNLLPTVINRNQSRYYYDAAANQAIMQKQYYNNMQSAYEWYGYGIADYSSGFGGIFSHNSPIYFNGTNSYTNTNSGFAW